MLKYVHLVVCKHNLTPRQKLLDRKKKSYKIKKEKKKERAVKQTKLIQD